ncbi:MULTISPECIES: hypothetical protein [unclassified Streptomyces]|uniref:hypothetical protein n=1 Tax=unclassified Streptomyces TaxID=2593676 RepID=UPI0012E9A032|nr:MULTISPECIES: hypothetical protein [unclassified Streptomyces]MUT94274.1 hypothetical protein [Streptomyces sp. Z38]
MPGALSRCEAEPSLALRDRRAGASGRWLAGPSDADRARRGAPLPAASAPESPVPLWLADPSDTDRDLRGLTGV